MSTGSDHSEIVRRQARLAPDSIAVMRMRSAGAPAETTTYRELDRSIDAVAHRLLGAGVRAGTVANVAHTAHYARLVVMLALARAGATSTPAADPAIAIVQIVAPGRRGDDAMLRIELPEFGLNDPIAGDSVAPVVSGVGPDDLAHVLASSGSTGKPKAIALTHRQFDRRLDALARAVAMPAAPRICCPLGPFGGYGYRYLMFALASGGTIVIAQHNDELARTIGDAGVQYLVLAPSTLRDLVTNAGPDHTPYPALIGIEVGGSHVSEVLRRAAQERLCPRIAINYGTAESGPVSVGYVDDTLGIPHAAGRVIPGVEVEIVDESGHPLAPGRTGRIRVRSEGCASGYFGAPPGAGAVFRDGWVYTRDTGTLSADRILAIHGRTGEIINAGGVKIAPADFEDRLQRLPGVADACVFAVADAMGVDQVWAAIVPGPGFDGEAFRVAAKSAMGAYAPRGVLVIRTLPRNANGKVLRNELVAIALAQQKRPLA
ncbi:MAG: acyl--CoA ligase [Burkholderiales bacterium]|nr:acyl--CoA ligase [Burkholderiales bacterium]